MSEVQIIPGQVIVPEGKVALLTGPITGTVTKEDGSVVDVSPGIIVMDSQDEADEVSFLIGERHVEQGHPDDYDLEDGERVQRQFVHNPDKKFAKHPGKFKGKAAGRPATGKG